MIQFEDRIFFKWVGKKPPTSYVHTFAWRKPLPNSDQPLDSPVDVWSPAAQGDQERSLEMDEKGCDSESSELVGFNLKKNS